MLLSPLPPFLDICNLCHLRYKTLFIVIIFLVLWFICLSSFHVHFKNGPDSLTKGKTQVFIYLMRFLLQKFSCSSNILFFFFFFHLHLFDGVCFHYSEVLVGFLSLSILILSWFGSLIPSIICFFPLLAHFSSLLCSLLCIFSVCDWMASSLIQIIMVKHISLEDTSLDFYLSWSFSSCDQFH